MFGVSARQLHLGIRLNGLHFVRSGQLCGNRGAGVLSGVSAGHECNHFGLRILLPELAPVYLQCGGGRVLREIGTEPGTLRGGFLQLNRSCYLVFRVPGGDLCEYLGFTRLYSLPGRNLCRERRCCRLPCVCAGNVQCRGFGGLQPAGADRHLLGAAGPVQRHAQFSTRTVPAGNVQRHGPCDCVFAVPRRHVPAVCGQHFVFGLRSGINDQRGRSGELQCFDRRCDVQGNGRQLLSGLRSGSDPLPRRLFQLRRRCLVHGMSRGNLHFDVRIFVLHPVPGRPISGQCGQRGMSGLPAGNVDGFPRPDGVPHGYVPSDVRPGREVGAIERAGLGADDCQSRCDYCRRGHGEWVLDHPDGGGSLQPADCGGRAAVCGGRHRGRQFGNGARCAQFRKLRGFGEIQC